MGLPTDRLPYADCAYIEATLSPQPAGHATSNASDDAAASRALHEAAARPLCRRDGRRGPLTVEALDALHFRYWSADHRHFDHIGFARAVIAAYAE